MTVDAATDNNLRVTTTEIRKNLKAAGKRVSVPHLYRLFARLGIRASGAKQRPQQYPPETADRIKEHFGLAGPTWLFGGSATVTNQAPARAEKPAKLIPLAKLKSMKGGAK